MKRIPIFLCVPMFFFVILTGCDGKKTEGNRFEDDKMVISAMIWEADKSFTAQPCELYRYIQNRFGIVFEPFDIGWDNYENLALLWAQADTLPDIIGGVDFVYTTVFREWIEAGIIRPLPNDLSAYPTLNDLISQQFVRELAVNGKNYFIPRLSSPHPEYTALARGIINRKDWRERLGIPVPETEEDFLNMWRAFADPANNLNSNGSVIFGVLPGTLASLDDQTFAGYGDTRTYRWVLQPDGNVVLPGLEPTALPLLSFLRGAYREGLIDPDFITNAIGDISWINFAQGRAGSLLRHVVPVHLNILYEFWKIHSPDIDFFNAVEILLPPRLPGIMPLFLCGTGFWSETYINAAVDDEKLDKILKLYDWLLSEEGTYAMVFGFEGKDWERQNDEIVMLTPLNKATGKHLIATDLYQFASGGMSYLAKFPLENVEWIDPNIPKGVRDMAIGIREKMLGPGMGLTHSDNRINTIALSLPEVTQFALNGREEWAAFITDTTALTHQELFNRFSARWTSAGYKTAKEAMTSAVAASTFPGI